MITLEQPPEFDDRIVASVRQYWNQHRVPLLLSRLGSQENGDIARMAKQRAGSLGAYLRRNLDDRIRVLQHSVRPPVIGAIPMDAEVGNDGIDALLDRTREQSTETTLRFHPAFWAAFRKPLDKSVRRYMSAQAPLHFRDTSPEERPDGFIEIECNYISGPDAKSEEVQQQVQQWLVANKIEVTPFLWKGQAGVRHLPSGNLLDRLILALEPDDLRRISMPLDIVGKLRRYPL